MTLESEQFEHKSSYAGGQKQRLELVKTLVAMANTKGGLIQLDGVDCNTRHLDSAAVDKFVNKYVEPRVGAITSEDLPLIERVTIRVAESRQKPHVFTSTVSYVDDKEREHHVFHAGQVWVRHSSGNSEARGDDIRRIVQEAAAHFLARVSTRLAAPEFVRFVESADGMPVRVSQESEAVPIVVDIETRYPYTTNSLGKRLGRSQNWVARAASVLALREEQVYSYTIHDPSGRVLHVRYSEEAFRRIGEHLRTDPKWNPWRPAR